MAQIFVSYASEDRERILPLVQALESDGFTVWWDREIRPGPSFDREIERAIDEAQCLVVVWSSASIESEWVRSEVEEGVRRGILVPAMIDADIAPPLAYRRRQSADLSDWDGESDGEYAKLISGIEQVMSAVGDMSTATMATSSHGAPRKRRARRFRLHPMSLAGLLFISVGLGYGLAWLSSQGGMKDSNNVLVSRLEVAMPEGTSIAPNVNNPLIITPDGKTFVVNVVNLDGETSYYSRDLDRLEFTELNDTDGLGSLCRADDGWIVFNDSETQTYRKIRIAGGASLPVAANPNVTGIRGLSWGNDGNVVIANAFSRGLQQVTNDGTLQTLTTPPEDVLHWYPFLINGGRTLLYTEVTGPEGDREYEVRARDMESGEDKPIVDGLQSILTSSNHLLFLREGDVWASAFDETRAEAYGKQVPVLESVARDETQRRGLDVSSNGTLVYVPPAQTEGSELLWATTNGASEIIPVSQRFAATPRLSPDDSAIVFHHGEQDRNPDLWTHTFDRGVTTRLSFDDTNVLPNWSPDGKQVVFTSGNVGSPFVVKVRDADGTGTPTALFPGEQGPAQAPVMSPDQQDIVYVSCVDGACNLMRVAADGSSAPETLLDTGFSERAPDLSPNGRWIAYQSDESGQSEVYVRPFPDVDGGRWQISVGGGFFPIWSRADDRLFFVGQGPNDASMIMAVTYTEENGFVVGTPEPILDLTGYTWRTSRGYRNFDISRDGERFVLVRSLQRRNRVIVVQNWFEELEQLVPTTR